MDHLKSQLQKMISHVASLPPNPTTEQLKQKVSSLSDALHKDALSLPCRINEIIAHGFLSMGWDIKRKRLVRGAEFSSKGLMVALEQILDQVMNWSAPIDPTEEELGSLSCACNRLWDLDVNRLVPNVDYEINVQGGKNIYQKHDTAKEPLFSYVSESVWKKPTYAAFVSLLDNYIAFLGQSEVLTDEERAENKRFLELIMDTAVMQYVHKYLFLSKKTNAKTREQFIAELDFLWFQFYSRKAKNDSSGFEHVFLGEITEEGEVTGFHNWIQTYLEEKKGNFDYFGYLKPKRNSLPLSYDRNSSQLVTIQFTWNGALKPASSSFIGTSPEFEVALYTLCFFLGEDKDTVQLGPYKVLLTSYTWPPRGKPGQRLQIATSFPAEAPLDENEAAIKIQSSSRSRNTYKKYNNK